MHEELEIFKEGNDLKISFNANYLLDILTRAESEFIEIELSTETRPALIRQQGQEDYTYVLMPMQTV